MSIHGECHILHVFIVVPVCFPCVKYLWILDAEVRCLEIKEVKQTLNGFRQGSALRNTKDRLKYSIDIWLKDAL